MPPWRSLFENFVQRTTQVISNYHYAYEDLTLEYVKEAGFSDFQECFSSAAAAGSVDIFTVIKDTRLSAEPIGKSLYAFFAGQMDNPEVDLPNEKGSFDFYSMTHARDEGLPPKAEVGEISAEEMKRIEVRDQKSKDLKSLKSTTCELIKKVTSRTWSEIDRAFQLTH